MPRRTLSPELEAKYLKQAYNTFPKTNKQTDRNKTETQPSSQTSNTSHHLNAMIRNAATQNIAQYCFAVHARGILFSLLFSLFILSFSTSYLKSHHSTDLLISRILETVTQSGDTPRLLEAHFGPTLPNALGSLEIELSSNSKLLQNTLQSYTTFLLCRKFARLRH